MNVTENAVITNEKIGINIQEAAKLLGISKSLMGELVKIPGFPCIKFRRRIVINKLELSNWFYKGTLKR